jgi:hypothetical protein
LASWRSSPLGVLGVLGVLALFSGVRSKRLEERHERGAVVAREGEHPVLHGERLAAVP